MDTTSQDPFLSALVDIVRQAASPEAQEARNLVLRRIALAGDLGASRLPAPKNITELGGYVNLLESLGQSELRDRMLASVLGVAMPEAQERSVAIGPVLFFASRASDHPACAQQATLPVSFTMRSDFLEAFEPVLKQARAAGCSLPLLTPARSLPAAGSADPSATDLLAMTGRILELAPTAALLDPTQDPLVLAAPAAGGSLRLLSRATDLAAAQAVGLTTADWSAWRLGATGPTQVAVSGAFLPLEPLLNASGWYTTMLQAPTAGNAGGWAQWTNITGLVPWRTTLGDELSLLYTRVEIAASAVREKLRWVWDGQKFLQT